MLCSKMLCYVCYDLLGYPGQSISQVRFIAKAKYTSWTIMVVYADFVEVSFYLLKFSKLLVITRSPEAEL